MCHRDHRDSAGSLKRTAESGPVLSYDFRSEASRPSFGFDLTEDASKLLDASVRSKCVVRPPAFDER